MGKEIYERKIRHQVEADHHGNVVAIDVDSGSWAVGDNAIDATDSLRTQRPDALDVWLLRVGHRALYRLAAAPAERAVIEGTVNAHLEAVVALHLAGPAGRTREIDAVIRHRFRRLSGLAAGVGGGLGSADAG